MRTLHSFKWGVGFAVLALAAAAAAAPAALAATLNYTNDTVVSFSSPAVSFTILAGSKADWVNISTSSMQVVMSSSTGGTFTLTSASREIWMQTRSDFTNGTVAQSCSAAALSTFVITQALNSTTYQFAPNNSQCLPPPVASGGSGGGASNGGGGSGGGGWVATPIPTPSTSTTSAGSTSSASALQLQITQLQAQLAALLAQVGGTANTTAVTGGTPAAGKVIFSRYLQLGLRGDDVRALQGILGSAAKGPAALALKNFGATGYFGKLTESALKEFQASVGIDPLGVVGPLTRKYLNSH